MLKYIVLSTLFVTFLSCGTKNTQLNKNATNQADDSDEVEEITVSKYQYPLFSPVNLNVDTTIVYLKDYFPNYKSFEITYIPIDLTIKPSGNELIITGQMTQRYDHLDLIVDNQLYSLVVKNHEKEKYTFKYTTQKHYDHLQIKGSFNGWSTTANPLQFQNGSYTFTTWLAPGTYEYVLVNNGEEINDETNNRLKPNGFGGQNNLFTVGSETNLKPFLYTTYTDGDSTAIFINSNLKVPVNEHDDKSYVGLWNNQLLENIVDLYSKDSEEVFFSLAIPEEAKDEPRSYIRFFYGMPEYGNANDLLIPLEYGSPILSFHQLNRKDIHDNIMYEVFVDRFYDGDKSNDNPVNSKELFPGTDWAGGDLQGLFDKMSEGYFKQLYVNDIWISPINLNPQGMYGHMTEYGVDTKFTGYHGYWPVSLAKIDPRFGDEKTLNEIIELAHEDDTNIIIDYVANHVHEEHPIVKDSLGWITAKYLPDGRKNNRLYDEQRLTTWFDDFMPTLDLERADVADVMTDSAVYWFKKYDIDGFRHDATKHIPNSFWRELTYKLKTEIIMPQGRNIYQIGETYGNNELINSYISTGMLDAQFDFNMFDAAFNGILNDDYSLNQTAEVLESSLDVYGYHNLMGNISGNHDKGRSISYADGSIKFGEDAKKAGYTRKINNINGKLGYEKMAQFFAFNMFIPGIPVIYYGDEIGMPGGDDPDNRRMMQFDNLDENQLYLKNKVAELAKYRREHLELIFGDTKVLFSQDNSIGLLRTYMGKTSILVISTSDVPKTFFLEIDFQDMINKEAVSMYHNNVSKNGKNITLELQPRSFDIIELQ